MKKIAKKAIRGITIFFGGILLIFLSPLLLIAKIIEWAFEE